MLMLKTVTVLEAISKRRRTARPAAHTGLSKNTIFAATHSAEDALVLLDATANGLTVEQATERLNAVGPNTIEATTKTLARRIADAFIDPFAGILAALALVSLYIDVLAVPEPQRDPSTVIVIGIMLLVSGGMKFIQEARSGNAAEALKDLVSNTCTTLRDGERIEIPFDELVPGDVIRLSAGDMVPADARIITARDLFVIESALTGESEAVEKTTAVTVVEGADGSALPLSACKNIVFTGTSVQNGAAMALVVATGSDTYLGGIAKMLNGRGEKNAFNRGVSSVSMLLVRLMLVMAPAVFAINATTKGSVIDALLFATSVAVGITPQMLPVIVTTSLSQGAKDLARRQVIVKELPAIQNLGAMDVLCCDKTGTLTEDRIVLERYLSTDGNEDARVLRHAFLNSFFQKRPQKPYRPGRNRPCRCDALDRRARFYAGPESARPLYQGRRGSLRFLAPPPERSCRRRPRQNPDGYQGRCRGNARDLLLCRGRWHRSAAHRREARPDSQAGRRT